MAGLDLFPRPRVVRSLPGGGAPIDAPSALVVDPSLPAQAFVLAIDDGHVELRHADEAGRRYGLATLDQVRTQAVDGRLPAVEVADHPDVEVRGFMLDVSRDRVPTRDTLDRLVGLMAIARLNHLELYVEHTYAFADHEEVWAAASPLTADDVAWLRDRCSAEGIELVANLNCFGHQGRWLAHDRYRHRAECPDGFELMAGVPAPPGTLAPTPDNAAFSLDLVRELLAAFDARRVNIGCDEPFELGRGASAADVAERGREAVYVDHVRRLAEPLAADGLEVLVWADVLRHAPELLATLPEAVTPIAWCYEAPGFDASALSPGVRSMLGDLGIDLEALNGFEVNVAPLAAAGRPFWVAPGTSSWCSIVGRIDNAVANLLDAAEAARAHRCPGYLVTDWGDDGHLQPPSVSFGPLLFGGAVAWGLDANRDLDVADLLDRHAFDDPTGRLGAAVVALGEVWAQLGPRSFNASPLHAAAVDGLCLQVGRPDAELVTAAIERIDAAIVEIERAEPRCPDAAEVVDELVVAARLARLGARRMLVDLGVEPADDPEEEVDALREDLRRAWLARARPGGMDDALARVRRR